jgi:hypothetical protein
MSFEEVNFKDINNIKKKIEKNENIVKISNSEEIDPTIKIHILQKLECLKQLGIKLSRNYNMKSNYKDLKYEFEYQKKKQEIENNKNLFKSYITKFGLQYDQKYDDLLDKILNKPYTESGNFLLQPETKLIMSLIESAFAYYLKNTETYIIEKEEEEEEDDNILKK